MTHQSPETSLHQISFALSCVLVQKIYKTYLYTASGQKVIGVYFSAKLLYVPDSYLPAHMHLKGTFHIFTLTVSNNLLPIISFVLSISSFSYYLSLSIHF